MIDTPEKYFYYVGLYNECEYSNNSFKVSIVNLFEFDNRIIDNVLIYICFHEWKNGEFKCQLKYEENIIHLNNLI